MADISHPTQKFHISSTSSIPLLTPSSPPSFDPHDQHSRQPYIAEKESIIEKKESTRRRNLREEGIYEKESIYGGIHLRGNLSMRSNYEKESTILSFWEAC
jgi:hypothetical protein